MSQYNTRWPHPFLCVLAGKMCQLSTPHPFIHRVVLSSAWNRQIFKDRRVLGFKESRNTFNLKIYSVNSMLVNLLCFEDLSTISLGLLEGSITYGIRHDRGELDCSTIFAACARLCAMLCAMFGMWYVLCGKLCWYVICYVVCDMHCAMWYGNWYVVCHVVCTVVCGNAMWNADAVKTH